jgi:hypothetical protein
MSTSSHTDQQYSYFTNTTKRVSLVVATYASPLLFLLQFHVVTFTSD